MIRGRSKVTERLNDQLDIRQIRYEGVGLARENIFAAVEAAGADGKGTSAEVFRAFDVVGCVADDDELFRRKIELQVFANAIGGQRGKHAAIVRLVAEGTR